MKKSSTPDGPNPSGLCMCGCGGLAPIAVQNLSDGTRVTGKPLRYIKGHARRLSGPTYLVQDCGYATPCWVWQLSTAANGYGRIAARGPDAYAHRVYYRRFVGEIPGGLTIDHLCRNKACVNPAHLEAVTMMENLRRGSKLDPEKVRAIRARFAAGESRFAIAPDFGVTPANVWLVVTGRTWADA